MAPSHSSHSLSRSRPWTRTRIHSQSQSLSLSLSHQSRSITITHAICLTFLFSCALSAILNVTAQSAPYSSADPSGPIQRNLWAQSPVFASFQGNTDYTKWDALIANGYASCETGPGTGVYYPCPKPTGGVIPWSLSCAGVLNPQGQAYASGQCPFQYSRYDGSNNAQTNYGEIFLHIPLSNIRAGTVLNFVGAVSQIYEAKSSETHYIFVDYFRGPFNHANFANGYFEPQVTNGATTFLFRDVILQEPAASYPNYTMINHNRPLPTNVTFAILHLAVSSGANPPPTHPQSIFDIKAYARELVTGPKVNIFYNGPTPARQTARVYLSTTQCLISGNFTNPQSQLSIVASSGVPILSQSLSLVTPGANQLYALDLTFPAGVTGDVTITMPSGSVYNEFNLPNNASNTLKLPVLTLVPSLTIYSPNYPIFPNAQQQRNIQFLFNFTTDVYGFDITRVGLCRTNYQNDTCATTDYKYVTTGTTTWEFPGFGNVTGTFLIDPNPAYIRRNYTLNLSNVPDGTYRVLVKRTDALSQASENLDADAFSRSPIRVDNVRPTVTITPNAPLNATQTGLTTYVNKDQLVVFRLVFSELIKHPLTSSQLQVIGGTIPTNGITPIVTEPQSTAPSNTWCTSITTANNNPATSSCRSEYFVQVNHAGTDPVRSIITLSYFPSDTVTALSIVDLANNPLNSTGTSFPEGFRNGSITFSNQNPTATLAVLESDLLTNEFAVSGQFKTHLPTVRYNITFDYPVENFDFAAQYAANNFTVAVTRFGAPATIPNTITWGPTTKLDNYTFQSNLTYGMNVPTTLLRLQLKPLSVADVAGNFNLQSNEHLLVIDTKPPNCTSVTYAAGQDRFAPLHTNFTNIRTLQYIFTFDERVNQATASAWATTFNNIYSRAHGGTFTFTTQDDPSTSLFSRVTATYTAASGVTDNGLNVAVRLRNVTDVFQNTAFEPFLLCTPLSFEFDFDPPNMTFTTDLNPFARINSTHLHVAPRYGAPLTKNSSVVITFQFDEAVNLTQAALLYRLEKSTTTLVNANTNITGFQGYNCNAAPFGQFCRNFNVTVVGEDTSYSILQIDPAAAPFVTDLAGNGVRNAGLNYTYLTDQTPPSVVLSTIYPFLDPSFRSNRQLVQIDLTFSKHIARFPGLMTGNCSNTTHSVTLTSVPLNYNGDPTSRTVFNALFNVSQADLMTCEFRIGPDAVFDTVGNTLTRTYSIFVSTRFQSPNAIITSPRGWLTNDLNPIPFCIVTDTEVVLFTPNFGGSSDALNITTGAFNRTQTATVPRVYDAILNQDLPTQNRTYNATSRTYCADIIPTSSAVTDIRVVIANGTIRDVYNNTNMLEFSLQIRRFDLNPYTYENLVKDGIIENRKLANNSVSGRNIQDGTIEQRHIANASVGTNQLIDGSVLRQDIAHGAVGSNEIAAGSINNTHLANSSVDTVKLADGAVTNTKLANNSITSEKIVDGSILTQDLANNSITFDKLVADAVRTINILNGSITTEKIAREAIVDYLLSNNSVETRDIKERAVTTTKIAIEGVTGTELANNSVVRRHLTNGSVDSTAILDGTIQQVDLANNSVGPFQLQNASVNTRHIFPSAVTTLEILDATIIQADLANNSIGRPQLQNDSVNEFKLANLSIETRHIKSGAVTVEELAIDAVTSVEIVNGSILHVDMANSSVGTFNIIPNSVTFLNMANNSIDEFNLVNSSVTERSIRDSAVTTSKIANEAVTNPKVAPNTINTTQIQDSGVTEINVANNSISSRTIIPQAVGTREIADSSIVNVKLANSSVSYRTIATGSIDSSKIIPGSILTESLSPQAIATINFQNRSILNEFIAPNAINSSQIQPGAVDTINIAVEAVGTAQLGFRAVTGEKIAFDTITLSHFTDDVNQYLAAIQAELSTSRPLDGSYIHNASLHGYKLANGAVGTQQIADSAVTTAKIAENAVTWFQIAPKTINSDNLGDSSVLGAAIAHGQIAPHHLVPDFFTNATLTNLANSLTNEVKGLDTDNFAPGSINAAQVVTPGSVTNDLIGDKEISLRKLSDSGFNMFVNMYNRLAQLEAQMTALLNNIDSRCIFNTTFSVATPAPVTPNVLSTHTPMHTSSVEHYMSIHPDLVAEMERRATEKNAPRTFHTAQVNAVNKYPATIVDGAKYCGDGAGKPANNGTQAPDNSGVILNSAANMSPSTLVMAVLALLLAFVQL